MEIDKQKINDIYMPEQWSRSYPIDLLLFFPKNEVKAIYLNKKNLFTDLKYWIAQKINLSKKQFLSINRIKFDVFSDIISSKIPRLSISFPFLKKKQRILVNPISITKELPKTPRNSLDIRNLEIIQWLVIHPDIYKLPPNPIKKIQEIYSKNSLKIKKTFTISTKIALISSIIILTSILFIIWYKNYLQSEVMKWYQQLYSIKEIQSSKDLIKTATSLNLKFTKLKILFLPINILANNFIYSNSQVATASNIINWWEELSQILLIWGYLWENFDKELAAENNSKLSLIDKINKVKLTDFYKKEYENIQKLNSLLKNTISYYSQINTLWNDALDKKFSQNLEKLINIKKYLTFAIDNSQILLKLAGDTMPVKYLILNQNKDEIRANWGFPGSVVTIDLYKWNVINIDKKDIYYYDWHLTPYRETPPEWLNIISPNHWLRDANYQPIFTESIDKINFFYEKAWGWSIDNVIWINQWLIEDLLKKYWSVRLDEIGLEITYKNFSTVMSILVENKFAKVISPKDILFKFSDKLEKKLISKKDYFGYFEILINNIISWDIVVWSRDKEIANYISLLWIDEKWLKDKWNWLYPVFTSIWWNKSDRYMSRDFRVISQDIWNCQVVNNFSLNSKHWFNENTRIEINKIFDDLKITDLQERNRLIAIQWSTENRQFVRILVPKWSIIKNTYWNNINIDDSNPKYTFFKFYLNTPVWLSKKIEFDYSLKIPNCQPKPIFYKQPGLNNYTFEN